MGLTEPSSKVEVLPEVVERVTAPRLFAPSTFASLMRCPLKEIHDLPDESMLPPSPLAILGDVIHEVMSEARSDRMLHRQLSTTAYVDELFERKLRCVEARLSEEPRTKRLVPIRRAVGKREYQNRRARLRDWVRGFSGDDWDPASESPMEDSRARVGYEAKPAETTSIPLGAERTIRVSSLRLSGRPDLIARDGDGMYHVTDFKTGDVLDQAGEPRADYALQVRLYALMLWQIDENASSRLWLEGSERVEVQWDENLAAATMEQLLSITELLPAGQVLYAADIAQPGAHCVSCRIRHRCQRYRSVAPGWWTEKSSRGSVAPFDIWGEVKEVFANGEETAEVVLQDAAGRRARVTGIRADGARPGDRMWFFDLQPTQRLPHHGLFVHPQNFHAKRPDRVWRDAVCCSEFIESRNAEWE